MDPASQPQWQRIGQRRAGPAADAFDHRAACPGCEQIAQSRNHPRGHIRARCGAIGHLVIERGDHDARPARPNIDELICVRHVRRLALCRSAA